MTITKLDFADVPLAFNEAVHELAAAVLANRPVCLSGSPGFGKTLLARRASGLITLDDHARRWLTIEYKALGLMDHRDHCEVTEAPFRAPHHTVSAAAMTGATNTAAHDVRCMTVTNPRCVCPGSTPRATRGVYTVTRPGEVALGRFGVLYLDDVTEFTRSTVEAIAHARRTTYAAPALIVSANPCACGWYGVPEGALAKACACGEASRERWNVRLATMLDVLGVKTTINVPLVGLVDLRGQAPRLGISTAVLSLLYGGVA